MSIPAAKILKQTSHIVPGKLKITEHFFEVPLSYTSPSSGTIRLFARSATKHAIPAAPATSPTPTPPWVLYLQGGPGIECRAPQTYVFTNTFVERGYQIIFLDQRGTGLSSPLSASTIQHRIGNKAEAQAKYMQEFRADNIVRDCEAVRLALTEQQRGEDAEKREVGKDEDWRKWSLIGQSFGGFCCVNYLSFFPKGLREVFITGGLPPVEKSVGPDDVYSRLIHRIRRRNNAYYDKYPEDVSKVKTIIQYLRDNKVKTPNGGNLSPSRFRSCGQILGFHGCVDTLHGMVLKLHDEIEQGVLTRRTLTSIESGTPFDTNPVYAFLHEPCYLQGQASNWSADRIVNSQSDFGLDPGDHKPCMFIGEMVSRQDFEDYSDLAPLAAAADLLAQKKDWPDLYNVEQLKKNEVPVYAAVYVDDMYVDFDLSMETASKIKGIKTLVTNRIYHDGLQSKEDFVLKNGLFNLRDDVID